VVDRRRAEARAKHPASTPAHSVEVAVDTDVDELRGFVLDRLSRSR
jgi:hypothetical protein